MSDNFNLEKYENPPQLSLSVSSNQLLGFVKWSKFCGIMDIVSGCFWCLGCITAPIGVFQILSGIKLFEAANNVRYYIDSNNIENISSAFSSFEKVMQKKGIHWIILLVFYILYIGVIIAVLLFGLFTAQDFSNNYKF